MLKIVSTTCSLLLVMLLLGCSSTHKSTHDDVNSAVLDKITGAVKNQLLFQEIMLADPVVKQSLIRAVQMAGNEKLNSIESKIATAGLGKDAIVDDRLVLAYALHPKYFFWKAKNDPGMNLILSRVDKMADKLEMKISDVKPIESKNDTSANSCSAKVCMGHGNLAIEYTIVTENNKMVVKINDANEKQESSNVPQHFSGSVSALCTTWENIKPTSFPPTNPQFIVGYDDVFSDEARNKYVQFGTIIPLELMINVNAINNQLRSYEIIQKQRNSKK